MSEVPIKLACRNAHRLISQRMDRQLTLIERVQLRVHLRICGACERVDSQMDLLRSAVRHLFND